MADSRQFGGPGGSSRMRQFGDKTSGNQPGDNGHCAQCEAMLADALDGTLSAADQEFFDLHMAHCGPCGQLLADARRGAAFLEILRSPAPEPPATMVERILAETSGAIGHAVPVQIQHVGLPGIALGQSQQGEAALAQGYVAGGAGYGNVIPFPRRAVAAMRRSSFGQIMLQQRLAMTAAMAFFSVALTMNITGVHPLSLRASDLTPSSLNRDLTNAKASVERRYENLRVVYELESRVHDLQTATDSDASAPPAAEQPTGQAPAAQPAPANQKAPAQSPAGQPSGKQPSGKQGQGGKPDTNSGTSLREEPRPSKFLLAAEHDNYASFRNTNHVRAGRKLV